MIHAIHMFVRSQADLLTGAVFVLGLWWVWRGRKTPPEYRVQARVQNVQPCSVSVTSNKGPLTRLFRWFWTCN